MAKITNERVYEINDPQDLLLFLTENMFREENSGIMESNDIPKYIRNVLYIIEFETDCLMQGVYIDNYLTNGEDYKIGRYTEAFECTGNSKIAEYIESYAKAFLELEEAELDELYNKIMAIIEGGEFWNSVIEYIKTNRQ